MRRLSPAALVVPIVLAAGALPAQETQPFSVHDMLAMERLSDPQMAPDGSAVAFTVRTTDLGANRGRTDIWIAPFDGSEPRRLTTNEAADFHPRWAPDGRSLFFLSTRSGQFAGVAPARRRRRTAPGDRPSARRWEPRRVAGWSQDRPDDGCLRRLREPRLHRRTARGAGVREDDGRRLRRPLRAPLGCLEGRPAVARLRPGTSTTRGLPPENRST